MTQEKAGNNFNATIEGGELVLTRTFHAPRELVFKTWTEAEHLARWWGPTGFN
ncbi:SRPBCC domain-containing protein [Paenibacillus alginolyticus]|uniref:SRPBCC domain-containing protein n=1 Tax=Paenibacillus alginolyticus TaxID=59839 RepID=A0ABT4G7C7_9BACL|nr:SRPBCC domain-containing protein [Paenibacillus alginolyticus]MCY9692075.1 SRPBCC domain-containing protein [Paenibacillus alginolyticus]